MAPFRSKSIFRACTAILWRGPVIPVVHTFIHIGRLGGGWGGELHQPCDLKAIPQASGSKTRKLKLSCYASLTYPW